MFELIDADPAAGQVRRITFVPFLADGRCVLIEEPGGPMLPAGQVRDGEDYVLDTVLRVPMETAGFRYQRFHPFALDGDHLYAWIEGGRYSGDRPHRSVPLSFCSAEEAAERVGDPAIAHAIRAAARSHRSQDEQAFHADNRGDRRRRDVPRRRLRQRAPDGVGRRVVRRTRPGRRALRCRHIASAGRTRPATAAPVGRPDLGWQRRRLAAAPWPALRLRAHPARLRAPGRAAPT